MQQTLLAFCALLIACLWALSQQRALLGNRFSMVHLELEQAAAEVARDMLDRIGSKPFDAAALQGGIADLSQLTWPLLPTGLPFDQCMDIDDVHGMLPYTYRTPDSLRFEVRAEVRYVDPEDPTRIVSGPTLAKEVTVTVTHPEMRAPVRLKRIFSYP
jgi:hypothetical protein|nr:MAG: hypothetical protein KatS3mg041_1767 [Bacteroidota bacterium]